MVTMKYGYFGDTGLKLSRIVLGTQTFGWSVDEASAFEILDCYVERGGNYLGGPLQQRRLGINYRFVAEKEERAPPDSIGHKGVLSY